MSAPLSPRLRFDTDFHSTLPFALQPVPRVETVTRAEFRREFQRPGRPVILEAEMRSWAATNAWTNPARLIERVGPDRIIYCRQRADPSLPYAEEYVPATFRQAVEEICGSDEARHYLTQGLIHRARGFNRRLARLRYPALLEELAPDCSLPSVVDPESLHQGVLWMGSGGQVTPLHFDEQENLNGTVLGRKRWLLFPQSEALNLLLAEHDGRGSVLSSLEMLTAGDGWRGGQVRNAFYCETGPGQMLYVPAGYLHQVYSSRETNIAVNFWYVDSTNVRLAARVLRARATRHEGFRRPARRAARVAVMLAALVPLRLRYAVGGGAAPEPVYELGPTSYGTAARGV